MQNRNRRTKGQDCCKIRAGGKVPKPKMWVQGCRTGVTAWIKAEPFSRSGLTGMSAIAPRATYFHYSTLLGYLFCTNQSSYLSQISQIISEEKKLSCGEISAFHVWQLWGNWKFLHMWQNFRCLHMTDVEKSEISFIISDLRCFVGKLFCCDLRAIAWRKF